MPHLANRIAKRQRAENRMRLQIAVSAQSEEGANTLWSQLEDHDEDYVNRAYDKGSVELFKQTVQRNRSFSK